MISWLTEGQVAAVTGGASGIGLAAAKHFLKSGMKVAIADLNEESLESVRGDFETADVRADNFLLKSCDVADLNSVEAFRDETLSRFGAVNCLMNNAGAGLPVGQPWENVDAWRKLLDINLWGVVHGCQTFIPAMLEAESTGAIINTGSKQGITKPPGNYAYNLSKTGVLAYTESVAHAFRQIENCRLSAHLLVPGFTYTGMISKFLPEKPDAAWTSEQVVDFMISSLENGDFYILCPDNDVDRETDEKRIAWNADDIIKSRPALSRWHPDYASEFDSFMKT